MTSALNVLMWTMMHATHFWLQESIFAKKKWIDFGHTHEWLIWMHRKFGILVGVRR